MWPSCQKTGSSLFRSKVRGQTSWLHHLGQHLFHPPTYTHKTFSALHGNGVPTHTAYNRTYFPSTLLMQQCYPIPPMLPPCALKTMRMRRGPSPSESSPWQRQHLSAKHTKTFSQRFLPHSSCQSKKGREVTKRQEYEISPLVHVCCAWAYW